MKTKLFYIIIFTFFLYSCANFYRTTEGSWRPKKAKFPLAKTAFKLKDMMLIDTNAVYINIHKTTWKNRQYNDTTFIRFYANGRCFSGKNDVYDDPYGINDYNNYNKLFSRIGYYKMSGNIIELEFFNVNLGGARGNVGYYSPSRGYVKNDSIHLFYEPSNRYNVFPKPMKENCITYIKQKTTGLHGSSDW